MDDYLVDRLRLLESLKAKNKKIQEEELLVEDTMPRMSTPKSVPELNLELDEIKNETPMMTVGAPARVPAGVKEIKTDISNDQVASANKPNNKDSKKAQKGEAGIGELPELPPKPKTREELIAEYNAGAEGHSASMKEARDSDRLTKLMGSLGQSASDYATAGMQMDAGVNLKPTKFNMPDFGSKAEELESDRATQLKDLLTMKKLQELDKTKLMSADQKSKENIAKDKLAWDKRKHELDSTSKGKKPTEIEKSTDRKYGKDLAEYTMDGRARMSSDIGEFREVEAQLAEFDKEAVGVSGKLHSLIPGIVRPLVASKSEELKNRIDKITAKNLKTILGGAFSEKEGENLLKRTYNVDLSEAVNQKSIANTRKVLEEAMRVKDAAVEWMNEHKTMSGFTGGININDTREALGMKRLPEYEGKSLLDSNSIKKQKSLKKIFQHSREEVKVKSGKTILCFIKLKTESYLKVKNRILYANKMGRSRNC